MGTMRKQASFLLPSLPLLSHLEGLVLSCAWWNTKPAPGLFWLPLYFLWLFLSQEEPSWIGKMLSHYTKVTPSLKSKNLCLGLALAWSNSVGAGGAAVFLHFWNWSLLSRSLLFEWEGEVADGRVWGSEAGETEEGQDTIHFLIPLGMSMFYHLFLTYLWIFKDDLLEMLW